jgi:predicted phosphodiesterase
VSLFGVDNWLRSPNDRDIISRWTIGAKNSTDGVPLADWYRLELPSSYHTDTWECVALGDTGDSDASGPAISPQDAVAQQMALDSALPNKEGKASLVLHMGDVIYMTGERRLYDRNFRRPYSDYLMPESTVDNFTFRVPFLPVPGNHDYYDLGGWALWLSRVPYLGAGLKALTHQLFAFSVPEGGSGMGRAYMEVFVDGAGSPTTPSPETPQVYAPGERTRVPNRYYRFRRGNVDLWALDSNTLDALPPASGTIGAVRENAAQRIQILEARAKEIDTKLRHSQRALDKWQQEQRETLASDTARRAALVVRVAPIVAAIGKLRAALEAVTQPDALHCRTRALDAVLTVERRWTEGGSDLNEARTVGELADAVRALEEASDEGCSALRVLEACLSLLPEGPERAAILGARDELDQRLEAFSTLASPAPTELAATLRALSEEALDVQRELSLERRRLRYRPEDHDSMQLRWLDEGLAASRASHPDRWRIVYLHHPLYTTIGNHSEGSDIINLRENLMPILQRHDVHLVLAGHAHAFEWFRSNALPNTGLFVTGGGGQITLRASILSPRRVSRHRERYDSLRRAGLTEYATGGYGPAAEDGEDGPLYHYIRLEVTPETLRVLPVGVRRLSTGSFRREEPMRVYHAPELPPTGRAGWSPRYMESVEIRRGQPPQAHWR